MMAAVRRIIHYQYLTNAQRLARGEWPWEEGIRSRLPDHYKRRYIELFTATPKPVHFKPNPDKWEVDEFGVRLALFPFISVSQRDACVLNYVSHCNNFLLQDKGG